MDNNFTVWRDSSLSSCLLYRLTECLVALLVICHELLRNTHTDELIIMCNYCKLMYCPKHFKGLLFASLLLCVCVFCGLFPLSQTLICTHTNSHQLSPRTSKLPAMFYTVQQKYVLHPNTGICIFFEVVHIRNTSFYY